MSLHQFNRINIFKLWLIIIRLWMNRRLLIKWMLQIFELCAINSKSPPTSLNVHCTIHVNCICICAVILFLIISPFLLLLSFKISSYHLFPSISSCFVYSVFLMYTLSRFHNFHVAICPGSFMMGSTYSNYQLEHGDKQKIVEIWKKILRFCATHFTFLWTGNKIKNTVKFEFDSFM